MTKLLNRPSPGPSREKRASQPTRKRPSRRVELVRSDIEGPLRSSLELACEERKLKEAR